MTTSMQKRSLTVSAIDEVLRIVKPQAHSVQQTLHRYGQQCGGAVERLGLQQREEAVGEPSATAEDEHLLLLPLKAPQHLVQPLAGQPAQRGALGTVSKQKLKLTIEKRTKELEIILKLKRMLENLQPT